MSQYSVIEVSSQLNSDLLPEIHRLRQRIFQKRLKWSVVTSSDMEIDHYDIYQPIHLAVVDINKNVIACARLVSTTKPYMLRDTFPILLGAHSAPHDARIYEVSRFAVDTKISNDTNKNGLRKATALLIQAIAEWSVSKKLIRLVAVIDVRMEKILSRSGWPIERYSNPIQIGETAALAGELPISDQLLNNLKTKSGIYTSFININEKY